MRICGEGGNFSLRKKVPSPAPLPPSKTAHTSTRKPSWPAGPEGFLVGRRMPPHAVCDAVSRDFFFRRVPLQDKPAPKNKTPAQGRRLTYGLCTTAQRWGPVHSSEKNVSGIGRGTGRKKASSYKNALFPSRHSDKIHIPILTADRHPAFMHMTTNGAITVSDVGAVRPKPPGSASQGHLLFSCG